VVCPIRDSATAMLCFVFYMDFTRFTTNRLFSQNPAANDSDIHLHFQFPIAESHARTPKTLILQAFTIGFEVSLFQGWRCEKRRVSVLRCFCTEVLFGVMVFFRWGMKVQVCIFSMFYLMVALFTLCLPSICNERNRVTRWT
jgi:hypothetical protein